MYKIQAFVKVMLVTSAVVVNAAVFAITGVPWATADPPIDTGGGSSGGGGPPGGIADAPGVCLARTGCGTLQWGALSTWH